MIDLDLSSIAYLDVSHIDIVYIKNSLYKVYSYSLNVIISFIIRDV